MEEMLRVLMFAYLCTGIIGAIGYLPTIKDLYWRKKPSANISSYLVWTITAGIAFLYSVFILPDLFFRIVSLAHLLSCGIILVLSVNLKRNHASS